MGVEQDRTVENHLLLPLWLSNNRQEWGVARAGGSTSGKSGLGTAFHDGGVAPTGDRDLADLRDSFHFDPASAEIRLGKRRMLLVDDIVLGQLRRELVRALGCARR
jgi:hypothetical protein